MRSAESVVITLLLIFIIPFSCDEDLIYSPELSDMEVVITEILIGADLMPIVAPDPVIILMTMHLTNMNETDAFVNFKIPSAKIYRASNDKLLGEFQFRSNWDGLLEPSETDTVQLRKKTEKAKIFSHTCNEIVYLRIKFLNSLGEEELIITDDKKFGCYY